MGYSRSLPVFLVALASVASPGQGDPAGDMGQAIALTKLARLERKSGKFSEAENASRRALDLVGNVSGKDSADYAIASGNLADDLIAQGKVIEAARLLKTAVTTYQSKAGTRTNEYANLLAVEGELLLEENHIGTAIRIMKQELQIRHVLGAAPDQMGVLYQDFAVLYDRAGRPKRALEFIEKARHIWSDFLPDDDPDKVTCVATQLVVYTRLRRYAEADGLVPYLLAHAGPALGDENPESATIFVNIGVLYRAENRYEEASAMVRRVR
jgi:tetratricopeptide (TPR) repeat protein